MGLMLGATHKSINEMMIQMMGEEGERQMHIVIGKRLSGCDTSTPMSGNMMGGMMMMMTGMMGGNSMMGPWVEICLGRADLDCCLLFLASFFQS